MWYASVHESFHFLSSASPSWFHEFVVCLFAFDSFRCFPPKSNLMFLFLSVTTGLHFVVVFTFMTAYLDQSVSDLSRYLEVFLSHGSNSVGAHLVFFCGLSGPSVLLSWPVSSFCWAFSLSDRFTLGLYFYFFSIDALPHLYLHLFGLHIESSCGQLPNEVQHLELTTDLNLPCNNQRTDHTSQSNCSSVSGWLCIKMNLV